MTKMRVNTLKKFMLGALLCLVPHGVWAVWPGTSINYLSSGQGQPDVFFSVSDEAGGVYNIWSATAVAHSSYTQVYVQHMDSSGTPDWSARVSPSGFYQSLWIRPQGGAYGLTVAWLEHYSSSEFSPSKMMVQRFNASGSLDWGAGAGIQVSSAGVMLDGGMMTVASDGDPVFLLPKLAGSLPGTVLVMQKVDRNTGTCLWPSVNSCLVSPGTDLLSLQDASDIGDFAMVPNSSRVIIAVSTGMTSPDSRIIGNSITNGGALQGEFVLAGGAGKRGGELEGLPDGSDGAYFVWSDSRTGVTNLFASRIDQAGTPSGMDQVQLTSLEQSITGISNMAPAEGGFSVIYTTGAQEMQRAFFGRVAANTVISTGIIAGLDAMSAGLLCRDNACYVAGFSGMSGGHDLVKIDYDGSFSGQTFASTPGGYFNIAIASAPEGVVASWAQDGQHWAKYASAVSSAPSGVNLAVQDLAPAYARYYYDTAALRLSLWADSGAASWSELSVNIGGTLIPYPEMSYVSIYRDDGDGTFYSSSDTYVAGSSVFGPSVALTMGVPETITSSTSTYFVTMMPAPSAAGKTAKLIIQSTASFVLDQAINTSGLPAQSSPSDVMRYIYAYESGSYNPDNNISVTAGQAVQIFSVGAWSYDGGSTYVDGSGSGSCSASCPLPSAPRGALIARGDSTSWFLVGAATTVVINSYDTLRFAMNDDDYANNYGYMMFGKNAIAATKVWTGGACATCYEANNPANWENGIMPAYGDNVVIGGYGNKDCVWDLNLTVNSMSLDPTYTGRVTMSNAATRLEISDFLYVGGGTFDLAGRIVAASTIQVTGGSLNLGGGYGTLEVGAGGLNVAGSGTLAFAGGNPAYISQMTVGDYYPVSIIGGTVAVNGSGRLNISGSSGVNISTESSVPALTFNNVGIYDPQAGEAALNFDAGVGTYTLNNWYFDETVSVNVNGSFLGGSALVLMNNAGGPKMGTPHEFGDIGNRVIWNPDGGGTGEISGLVSYSGSISGDYLVVVTTDIFSPTFVAKSTFSDGNYAFAGLKAPATYYLWSIIDLGGDLDFTPAEMEPVAWSTSPVILSAGGAPTVNMNMLDTGRVYGTIDRSATNQAGKTYVQLYQGGAVAKENLYDIRVLEQWDYDYSMPAPGGAYTLMAYVDANQNGRLDAAFESSGTVFGVSVSTGASVQHNITLNSGAAEPGGAISVTTASFVSGSQIGKYGSAVLMKLGLLAGGGAGTIRSLQFDSTGTAQADKFRLTVYKDDGNGVFDNDPNLQGQSYSDMWLGDSYFGGASSQAVVWFQNDVPLSEGNTQYFFVTVMANNADVGSTFGAVLASTASIGLLQGVMTAQGIYPAASPLRTVSDTIDVWSTLYSGLEVRSGQTISVSASGAWRINGAYVDATGTGSGMYNGVLSNAPVGALIARVGEYGPWFYVGTSTSMLYYGEPGQLQMHVNVNYDYGSGTWNYPYDVSGQLYLNYSVSGDTHAVLSGTVTYNGGTGGDIIINAVGYFAETEVIIGTCVVPSADLSGGTSFYTMTGIEIPYGDAANVLVRAYMQSDPGQYGFGIDRVDVRIGQPATGGDVTVYPGSGVVIGTVTYPSGTQQFGDIVVALFASLSGGEPVASTSIPQGVSTFSVAGVPAPADYYVLAFKDTNYDEKPNGPEPFGYYGAAGPLSDIGSNASTITVSIGEISTVPAVISLQDMGQVQGRISLGDLQYPSRLVVKAGHGVPGFSFQVENWDDYQAQPCSWYGCVNEIWYNIGTLTPADDYAVVAFLDNNGNGQWDCSSAENCERFASSRRDISVAANGIAEADLTLASLPVPAAPQSFSGTVISTAQILWTWSDAATETGYYLTDSTGSILHALGANTTFYLEEVAGGANSLSPVRAVQAYNFAGNSALSVGLALYTKAEKPLLTVAGVTASGVTLNITGATNRFWLARSTASVGGYNLLYSSTTGTPLSSYPDVGLYPATTYYYRALNFNAQNLASELSEVVSTMTDAASGAYISGIVNYPGLMSGNITIHRSTSSSMSGAVALALSGNTTQEYYLSGLSPSTSYYLRAFVDYNDDGMRHASEDASAVLGPVYVDGGIPGQNLNIIRNTVPPAPPSGLAAIPGFQQVSLNWNASASANVKGYVVLRSANASFSPFTVPSGANLVSGTTFTDSSPLTGVPAYYRVKAVDWGLNPSTPTVLNAPVTASAGGTITGTVYAVDTSSTGFYHIRVSTTSDSSAVSVVDKLVPLSPSTYTVSGLPDGTYYVRGYRDVNGDFKQDRRSEPSGTHGGIARPFDIYVTQGGSLSGINLKVCNRFPLAVGVSTAATISGSTCEALDRGPGYYTRIFTFEVGYGAGKVPPGSQITAYANNITIGDPFLYLIGPSGDVVASDDDSGGDRNSRIQYTVNASGIYLIEPTSYNSGAAGDIDVGYEVTGGFAGLISGTLGYSGAMTGTSVVQIYTDLGTNSWPIRTSTSSGSAFEIFGLQDGYFYLKAFKDVNANGVRDAFEPYGVYGGTTPVQFQVNGGVTTASLNVTLAEPAVGSVSGYLTYYGGRSGAIRVEAARPRDGDPYDMNVIGFSTITRSGTENISQAYALSLLAPATDYTIRAFVDENANGRKDIMEPFASVLSTVTASTNTAGVNLNVINPGSGASGNSIMSGYIGYTPIPGQGYVSTGNVWVGWASDQNFDNILYSQTVSTFTQFSSSTSWSYSKTGILGGTSYYIAAFLDINGNGQPDEDDGEPVGMYAVEGEEAQLYVPLSSTVVKNISLESPATGYINGVLHYYGSMTGPVRVNAWNGACESHYCSATDNSIVISSGVNDYPFALRFLDPTTSYALYAVIDLNLNERTDPGEPNAYLPSYTVTGTTAAMLTILDPDQMSGGNMGEIRGVITYSGNQNGSKIVRLFRGGFNGAPLQTLNVDAFCAGDSCAYMVTGLQLANDYYVDAYVDTSFNGAFDPAYEPSGRIASPIAVTQAVPSSRGNSFSLYDPGAVIVSTGSGSISGAITVRGPATSGVIRTRLYAYGTDPASLQVPVRVASYTYAASVNYSFQNLPSGNYFVQAYADHNGNFVMGSTEAWGQTRTSGGGINEASAAAQKALSICVRAPITAGQTVSGSLESSDCLSSDRSSYVDYHSFSGNAGDIVTVEMTGVGFSDTYLYLYAPVVTGTNTYTGGSGSDIKAFNLLAADDNGAGNLNARISEVRLPASGVYTIGAASYGSNITGAYTLSLRVSGGTNGSIAGTVRYNGTQGGNINIGLFDTDPRNQADTNALTGVSLNVPGDFSFSDLPAGTTYYLGGFVDVNFNNYPDAGEDFGLYPNPIFLRTGQNVGGILLEINSSTETLFVGGAGQGTIAGAISYAGASTATSLVVEMWNTATFMGTPVGIRTMQVGAAWPVNYDLQVPGNQTYYLKAFLDSNNNRMPDLNEAKGAFEPHNEGPEPIYVGSAAYVSDRDFTLYDPGQTYAGGTDGASGEGWAVALPASVPAGSQFTTTVTVRVNGLGAGGTVLVGLPNNLWSSLTTGCPACSGNVEVSLDGTTYNTVGLTIPPPPPGSYMQSNTAKYEAPAGGLAAGTSVYFAIHNLYAPCQGATADPLSSVTDNTLSFHVGTSSTAFVAPQPLANGEPSLTLSAGAPQNMSFRLADSANSYNMAVPNGEATAMLAEARDNCWNLASMPSVYIATVSAYRYEIASNGYVLDNSVKFSSWPVDASAIPETSTAAAVRFEAGSSTGTFYMKPTAQGYRNIGLSYDLGWPNTFYMGVQVLSGGGITGVNVSTGVYNNFSASSMTATITPNGDGNADRAYINFVLSDPNMGWHVAVSSIPYGRGLTPTPLWETWGWGQPNPGHVFWEGRYSPWMNNGNALPTGAYFVRIEAGSLRNDTLRINVVVPQVSGQVTDAGTSPQRPLSGVSVNAYGMSGWGQAVTDTGGNFVIPGLAQGQYNFQFSKEEYGMVSSQTVIGANGGTLNVNMRRAPALILVPSLTNATTQQYDQWGWINVHTANWDKTYNGSLRIPASTSATSVAYIDDGGRWDASTNQFTTRRRIRFDVEPATYTVEAELSGYGRVSTTAYVGSAGLELTLPSFTRKANISGLVNLPGSNANGTWISVNALPVVPSSTAFGGWGGVWLNQGVTVSTYNIYGLDPGTYTIRAQVPGYSGVSYGPVIVGAADITGVDMPAFGTGYVITGTVAVLGDTTMFSTPTWASNWEHPIKVNINVWSPQTFSNGWTEVYVATGNPSAQSTFTITGLDSGTTYQMFADIDFNRDSGNDVSFVVPGGLPKQVYVGASGGTGDFSFAMASGTIAGTILLPTSPTPDFSRLSMNIRITRSDNPYAVGENFTIQDISIPCGPGNEECLPGFSSSTATGEAVFEVSGLETQTIEVTFTYGLTGVSRKAVVNVISGSTSTVVMDLRSAAYPISGSITNQISNPSFNTMALAIANSSFTLPAGYPSTAAFMNRTYIPIEAVRRDLSEFGVAISTGFDLAKTRVGFITQAGTYTITGLQDGVYVVRTLPLRLCTTCEVLVAAQEKVVTVRGGDYEANNRVLADGVYVGTGSVDFTLIDGWNVSGAISIENSVQDARTLRLTLRNRRNEVVRSTSVSLGNAATNSLSNSVAYSFPRLPGGEFYTLEVRDTKDANGITKYAAAPLRFPDIGSSPNGMQSDLSGQNVTLKQGAMINLKLRDFNSSTLLTQSNYSLLASNFGCFANANPWVQGGYYVAASSIAGRPIEADGTVRIGPVMPEVYYDVRCEQANWDVGYMRSGAQNYSPAVVSGIRPSAGETRDLGVLDLKQGQSMSGNVRDRSGRLLSNIKIVAKPSYVDNPIVVQTATDRDGRYTLWASTYVSRYFDVTAAPWEQSQGADASTVVYRESVYRALDLTRTTTADFTLDVVPGGVSGNVITVDSAALSYPFGEMQGFPSAALFIQPYGTVPKNNPIGDIEAVTEAGGAFSVPLSTGVYTMRVVSLGYSVPSATFSVSGSGMVNIGTMTLVKGGTVTGQIRKPDSTAQGGYTEPNSGEITLVSAANDGFSEFVMGTVVSDPVSRTITRYTISGFKPEVDYSLALMSENGDLTFPPEGSVRFSQDESTATKSVNLTFRPSRGDCMVVAKQIAAGRKLKFVCSKALRNRTADDNDLALILTTSSVDSSGAAVSAPNGTGSLSGRELSADRKTLTVVYSTAASEGAFSVRLAAYTSEIDPATGENFMIDRVYDFYTGVQSVAASKINNMSGGRVELEGEEEEDERGAVEFAAGSFALDGSTYALVGTTVTVELSKAESSGGLGAGVSASAAGGAPKLSAIRHTVPGGIYEAMRALREGRVGNYRTKASADAGVNPFSSFYDIALPAGISHSLLQPARITLSYDTSLSSGVISDLNVYYYNPDSQRYVLESEGRSVDTDNGTISVNVDHLSVFVVLAQAPVAGATAYDYTGAELKAHNFPNPFNNTRWKSISLNDAIAVGGYSAAAVPCVTEGTCVRVFIPRGTSGEMYLKIFNIAGELVREMQLTGYSAGTTSVWPWDGRNGSGERVASGVYIGEVKVGNDKTFFKMAVIKSSKYQ